MLGGEETEKVYQQYWRLNNLPILDSIYQEIKEEIANFIDIYYKIKENRSPKEITKLIDILQESIGFRRLKNNITKLY